MIYNTDYFIEKFEAIPEDEWITGFFTSTNFTTGKVAHCARGHCGIKAYSGDGSYTEEAAALGTILNHDVIPINDGYHPRYRQHTPKQRTLAALHDIKTLKNGL